MNFYSGIPAYSPLEPADRLVHRCAMPLSGDQPVAAPHLPAKAARCHAV